MTPTTDSVSVVVLGLRSLPVTNDCDIIIAQRLPRGTFLGNLLVAEQLDATFLA